MDNITKMDIVPIDLKSGNLHRSWLNHAIGSGDNAANAFGVDVYRDGQPVNLTGGAVQGFFRNPLGTNIAITSGGTIDGNRAYITLPQACYANEGQFTLAIKIIGGGVTGTMRIVDGIVDNTNTDAPVAPTGTVPTYQEVLAQYDEMNEVLEDYQDVVDAQNEEISSLKNALTQFQSLAPTQWIDNSKIISGRYWKHGVIDYSSSPSACTLNYLIPIIGNVKYCYTDLYAYFCNVKYSNGTVVALSNTTNSKESGEFTASDDGVLYVTMYYANGEATANAAFYNTEEYPTEKVVGVFDPRANGLDASKFVTKGGTGQVDEKNTTFFVHGDNLFDKSDTTVDVRLTSDGTDVKASSGFATSGYINLYGISSIKFLVTSNSVLRGASGYYALYDSSKNVITARTLYEGTGTIDTSSAVYMRVSYSSAQTESFMVTDGSKTYSAYVPYGWKFSYSSAEAEHAKTADKIEIITVSPTDDIIGILKDNAGKHIFFSDGEYDIVAIYKSKYGNSYFDNYSGYNTSDVADRGLPILRNTHIECSKGAKFIGTYSGSNTSVRQNFSAFALESGVVVDGLNVDITGLRNVIHDDFDNSYSAKTVLKNCNFKADTNNIAGGLGFHDIVIIENCKFKDTNSGHTYDISYHNNGNANAQSELVIKDNYFYKGISLRWYGPSTLLTDALVSNNSMANAIEKRAENSSALIDNIDLTEWNNVIRN